MSWYDANRYTFMVDATVSNDTFTSITATFPFVTDFYLIRANTAASLVDGATGRAFTLKCDVGIFTVPATNMQEYKVTPNASNSQRLTVSSQAPWEGPVRFRARSTLTFSWNGEFLDYNTLFPGGWAIQFFVSLVCIPSPIAIVN